MPRPTATDFPAPARIDTPAEAAYLHRNGVLPFVLRRLLRADEPPNESQKKVV
jgi:hypothetical protein